MSLVHNHGYPTVDPLKRRVSGEDVNQAVYITTVIRPWTH